MRWRPKRAGASTRSSPLLVNNLVEQGELDGEELRELHAILERAEKQKKNRENEPKPVD